MKLDKNLAEKMAREYASKNNGGSDPRYCGLEDGYFAGLEDGQNHILSQASEGFEEWFKHERGNILLHEDNNIITATERDFYRWERQAWQAARLSNEKELQRYKDGAEYDSKQIEFLNRENARLREKIEQLHADLDWASKLITHDGDRFNSKAEEIRQRHKLEGSKK